MEPVLEDRPPSPTGAQPALSPLPPWKRAIDIFLCLLALPLLGVCTLLMTIVIRLTSPGPVLFTQERIGYLGRRFVCFKFRTMKVAADTASHRHHLAFLMRSNRPLSKMDSARDSRLIPGAWILRASGLDELPQIVNVLRGEMSIVGPRPCLPYEFEEYQPWQKMRFNAMPGLTGLWQVSGKYRTTFEEMIRLDLQYIANRSLLLDVKIVLKTIPALLVQMADTRRSRKQARLGADQLPTAASRAPSN